MFCGCSIPVNAEINSFEECAREGNPIRKSLPAQCVTKEGIIYIDEKSALKIPAIELKAKEEKFCKDLCGDSTCQEIVCMGQGCPCPESAQSCPEDCK